MCTSIYNTRIQTVSALCGLGKTTSLRSYIQKNHNHFNFVIVQSSTDLLKETKKDLKEENNIESTLIYDTEPVKRTIQYIKNAKHENEVLLINWECYNKLPEYYVQLLQKNWKVFIDEIPQIDKFYPFNLLENESLLSDKNLNIEPVNETLALVTAKNRNRVNKIIKAKDATYSKEVKDFFRKVNSPFYDVFVNADDFNKADETSTIYFIAMLNPALFKRTTLMGANLESNMLYHWFKNFHGVSFVNNVSISNNLLPERDFSNRLEIIYLTGTHNSKYLKNKTLDNGMKIEQAMHQIIKNEFKAEPYLYSDNNGVKTPILDDVDNAERIKAISKGVNHLQNYKNIAHLPAMNRSTNQLKMLNQLGINNQIIQDSTGNEALYQNVMRTCLRNKDNNDVVKVIVVSKNEAEYLVSVFGGKHQKVKQVLDTDFKKYKEIPFTPVERNNISKFKKASSSMVFIGDELEINIYKNDDVFLYSYKENSNQKCNSLPPIKHETLLAFQNSFISDSKVSGFSYKGLRTYLNQASKGNIITNKSDQKCLNSSIFEGSSATDRTYDKHLFSTFMILDFDGGDLSIEQFEKVFYLGCETHQRHSHIIHNTFSRTESSLNNYRVLMPFSQPASIKEYEATFDYILGRLEDEGFTLDSMKLDIKSRSPVQPYYLPCTNRQHKEQRYFNANGWRSNELKDHSLNPKEYVDRTALIPSLKRNIIDVDFSGEKSSLDIDVKIANARKKYIDNDGQRNNSLFDVAITLKGYRLNYHKITMILTDLAGNNKDAKDKIKGIIKTLKIPEYDRKLVA